MRLWSLHPSLLDQKGLDALWRESLLAQNVLQGKTKGYRSHPSRPTFGRYDEAARRGYTFNSSKIARKRQPKMLTVTQGQLEFELGHLKSKLLLRDPKRFRDLRRIREITAHPLFTVIAGEIESWERP